MEVKTTFTDDEVASNDSWLWLKEKYQYTCLRCKRKEPDIKLVSDHIIPKSKHGPNLVGNIQPLCKDCNTWKGVKAIDYRPDRAPLAPIVTKHSGVIIPSGAHITYQLQYRKCNKPVCSTCRSAQAIGHGPYWYAYWRESGKLLSCYVGRKNVSPQALISRLSESNAALHANIATQQCLF